MPALRLSRTTLRGRGPDDLYAVGGSGVILHFNGRDWTTMRSPTKADLLSVTGGASTVWAAGADGALLRLDRP